MKTITLILVTLVVIFSGCASNQTVNQVNASNSNVVVAENTSKQSPNFQPDFSVTSGDKRQSDFDIIEELQEPLYGIETATDELKYYPKLAKDFRPQLPKIKKQIDIWTQDVKDVEIDIFLMKHPTMDRDRLKEDPGFLESQTFIKKGLTYIQPEIVAIEGHVSNTVTAENQAKSAYKASKIWAKVIGEEPTPFSHFQEVANYDFSAMGDRLFLKDNPKVIGIGLEHERLYEFGIRWLELLEATELRRQQLAEKGLRSNTLTAQNVILSYTGITYLRSEYGISKLIAEMKKRSLKKGALVIGLLHGPDLVAFCQTKGIKANFYYTCPKNCVEVNKKTILSPAY